MRSRPAFSGDVGMIREPGDMALDFRDMVHTSAAKMMANVSVRLWSPKHARIEFVRQVSPSVNDLTGKAVAVSELVRDYPTGSWASGETRDYHVCINVAPQAAGAEMLAARVSLVVDSEVVGDQGMVKAIWTDDTGLSSRIDGHVAHYTGQVELAAAIQDGLAAKQSGDEATATVRLGRAVQLATQAGNDDTVRLLEKVVDVDDPVTGTVRLKRNVDIADAVELDTRSTKTVRVKRDPKP